MASMRVEQVQARLSALAAAGLDVRQFEAATVGLLRGAIPYDGACVGTVDPDTELLTGHYKLNLPEERDEEFARFEYETDDVNKFTDVARRSSPVGLLSHDTDGDPARSVRFRELIRPHFSFGHELRFACRYDNATWGVGSLYREDGAAGFSTAEADVLARLTPLIALGLRAALVVDAVEAATAVSGPAVIVVDAANEVAQASPAAAERVAELGGDLWGALPFSVIATVAAARAQAAGRQVGPARGRYRTPAGRWLVVHAAPLASRDGSARSVVVTIEEAGPPDVVPLVIAAFGLTGRERDVVSHVLQGAGTTEIAKALHLSPHTVQDHLKSIFDKAGVRSRKALLARVYFDHYHPNRDQPRSRTLPARRAA